MIQEGILSKLNINNSIKKTIDSLKKSKSMLSKFKEVAKKRKLTPNEKSHIELLKKNIEDKSNSLRNLRVVKYGVPAAAIGIEAGSRLDKWGDKVEAKTKEWNKLHNPKKVKEGNTIMSVKLNVAQMIYESNDIQTRDKIDMLNDVKYMNEDEVLVWLDEINIGKIIPKIFKKVNPNSPEVRRINQAKKLAAKKFADIKKARIKKELARQAARKKDALDSKAEWNNLNKQTQSYIDKIKDNWKMKARINKKNIKAKGI